MCCIAYIVLTVSNKFLGIMDYIKILQERDVAQLFQLYERSCSDRRVMYHLLEACHSQDKVLAYDGQLAIHLDGFLQALSSLFNMPHLNQFMPYKLIMDELSVYQHIIDMECEGVIIFNRIGFYAAVFDIARRHYLSPKAQVVMEYLREAYEDLEQVVLTLPPVEVMYHQLVTSASCSVALGDKCYDLHFTCHDEQKDLVFTFEGVDKTLNFFVVLDQIESYEQEQLVNPNAVAVDTLTRQQLLDDYDPLDFDGLSFSQMVDLYEEQRSF